MGASAAFKPSNLEGWLAQSPAALETLRSLLDRPAGRHITDLERRIGDPAQVVRTLNQLQNAGLVTIQVERVTHELIACVPPQRVEVVKGLLLRIS